MTIAALQVENVGTEITRFNALKHGILSRYTVLPWEDADEYKALVGSLTSEHMPEGPTEEHLVEELAGILWCKRRLRLAEAALHQRGLDRSLESYRETVKVALVHLDSKILQGKLLSNLTKSTPWLWKTGRNLSNWKDVSADPVIIATTSRKKIDNGIERGKDNREVSN